VPLVCPVRCELGLVLAYQGGEKLFGWTQDKYHTLFIIHLFIFYSYNYISYSLCYVPLPSTSISRRQILDILLHKNDLCSIFCLT
jgi:hypothetical protein